MIYLGVSNVIGFLGFGGTPENALPKKPESPNPFLVSSPNRFLDPPIHSEQKNISKEEGEDISDEEAITLQKPKKTIKVVKNAFEDVPVDSMVDYYKANSKKTNVGPTLEDDESVKKSSGKANKFAYLDKIIEQNRAARANESDSDDSVEEPQEPQTIFNMFSMFAFKSIFF